MRVQNQRKTQDPLEKSNLAAWVAAATAAKDATDVTDAVNVASYAPPITVTIAGWCSCY